MPTEATAPVRRGGEVWLATLHIVRPVVVLTRDPLGRYLHSVLVGPVTSTVRGLSTEVVVDSHDGLRGESVVNLDNAQLVPRTALRRGVGAVRSDTMAAICNALAIATGCER